MLAAKEKELAALEEKLIEERIAHVAIREPDEPWRGALTAIGLVPVANRASLRHLLSSFPLYRGKAILEGEPMVPQGIVGTTPPPTPP